ncbi:Bromodomain [Penicillium chermesinum]|nr:Bromodomain [Penicillium chermesinum]
MDQSDRGQSQPQPEDPVTSIENDGAVSEEQWRAMMDVIMAIYDFREPDGHDPSRLFHRSVNKRVVPDYYDIIKEPMALSILKQRINKREYRQFKDFVRDCALIPHNAQTYNRPKSQAYEDALVIKDVFHQELKKLVDNGVISAEEAEFPDLGEIPEADPVPDEEDEDEDEEEEEEEDSDDEGRRRKKPGPKPGSKRGGRDGKQEPDLRKKRGRPPRVDTPMETRIKTILKGLRKFKGPGGHLKVVHFERLPDKSAYPDYYMEIKEPIAIDIIKRKSKRKKYNSVDHFMRDLDLMFENAKAYNQSESQIYKDAVDLQTEARKLAEQEKKKPDSEYLMEDGRFPCQMGYCIEMSSGRLAIGFTFKTPTMSPNLSLLKSTGPGKTPSTVHHFEKHFYPNEVVKTGQYRDHRIDEIVDRCFVMFFTRYSRGRPRDLPPGKEIYVCEARYNEEKHKLNKIKTWASCLPDEVREKDYEMDLFDVPRKIRKHPSPIKHLLKEDAKETDDLPRPTWGADNAPPVVGAVHRRPRDENPLPTVPLATSSNAVAAQTQAPMATASVSQVSPAPVPQTTFQTPMNTQMYQAQRRPSNFMQQTPTTAYQTSPAPQSYPATAASQYGSYTPNRLQTAAPVYNPNAPRTVEVFHLSDAANLAIPADIRRQFHCDDKGHVLFFSTPPLDLILPVQPQLTHSLKYLARREDRQKKVAERKRKREEEEARQLEEEKRRRVDEEIELASRIQALVPRAVECMVKQVVAGTEELYDIFPLEGAGHSRSADDQVRANRILNDQLAKQQTEQIQAQSHPEGFVNLKGSAVYLGDSSVEGR